MRLRSGANVEQDDKHRTVPNNTGDAGSISGSSASTLETIQRGGTVSEAGVSAVGVDAPVCVNNDHCPENRELNTWRLAEGLLDTLDNDSHVPVMGNTVENHVASGTASTTAHTRQREALLPHNKYIVWSMKVFGYTLVLFFFIIPAFIKVYPAVVVHVAFLNHFRWPPFVKLDRPAELGLNYTRVFKLDTTDGVTVGAWHVLPEELVLSHVSTNSEVHSQAYLNLLQAGNPVVLYLHGNAGTRAGWHRVQLYKVLSKAGFHVVTFDYRGYGDSTGSPSEEGLVQDSISVFRWLRRRAGSNVPLYIWGHSLGSGVATKTASRLCQEGAIFNGLILESPFTNFVEAASNHPFSLPFRVMPWFSWVFIEAIKLNNIRFESDKHINGVTVPVIILHATDDGIVPYELGRKLYEVALRRTPDLKVDFVTFDGVHGYGHKHIHKSPQLVGIIRKFASEHNTRN